MKKIFLLVLMVSASSVFALDGTYFSQDGETGFWFSQYDGSENYDTKAGVMFIGDYAIRMEYKIYSGNIFLYMYAVLSIETDEEVMNYNGKLYILPIISGPSFVVIGGERCTYTELSDD